MSIDLEGELDAKSPDRTSATPDVLDQLAALHEAATPGPWEATGREIRAFMRDWIASTHTDGDVGDANAALIVAMRNALPSLIAEIRSLRKELGRDA